MKFCDSFNSHVSHYLSAIEMIIAFANFSYDIVNLNEKLHSLLVTDTIYKCIQKNSEMNPVNKSLLQVWYNTSVGVRE